MSKKFNITGTEQIRKATMATSQVEGSEALTFVIISPDNAGMRWDWDIGEYMEELDINGANSERLNTFFKDHRRGVDDAIGRVTNVRKDGNSLLADVVFGTDGQSIRQKYEEGILTDVSIGYRIRKYDHEKREGEPDLVTVREFDIFELSAVGIGFDQGAKKRGVEGLDPELLREMNERLDSVEAILK